MASASLLVLLLAGCNYSFSGGGGLPSRIRTVYIAPFPNETEKPELDPQINRALTDQLPRALGLRLAGERSADLLVQGKIARFNDEASNYRPGSAGNVEVEQHQVIVTIEVQLIDVRDNLIRYEATSLQGRGLYRPSTQSDNVALTAAIQEIVQKIVDGAQSQW